MDQPKSRLRRSTAQGALTRERILDSARALVAERGLAGTTIGALCEQTGVAPTAIYWHFGSKEGLLAELFDQVSKTEVEQMEKRVARSNDPLERLELVLSGLRENLDHRPSFGQLLFALSSEGPTLGFEIQGRLREGRQRVLDRIVEHFQVALGKDFPDLDLLARLILAFNHEAALVSRSDPSGEEAARVLDCLRRALVLIVGGRVRERTDTSSAPGGNSS